MIDGSLITEYLFERQGIQVLEKPDGFIFYRIAGAECKITDMSIRDRSKGTRLFRDLINDLCDLAREKGCSVITANVHAWDKGKEHSLSSAFKLDFKILSAESGVITIGKEI